MKNTKVSVKLKAMNPTTVEIEDVEVEAVKVVNVAPFNLEFNNEGLNSLKDKLNEVIEFLNK